MSHWTAAQLQPGRQALALNLLVQENLTVYAPNCACGAYPRAAARIEDSALSRLCLRAHWLQWHAASWCPGVVNGQRFDAIGCNVLLEPYGQGYKAMSPAIDIVERPDIQRKLRHGHTRLSSGAQPTPSSPATPLGGASSQGQDLSLRSSKRLLSRVPPCSTVGLPHLQLGESEAHYVAGKVVGGLFRLNYPDRSGLTGGAAFGKIADSPDAPAGTHSGR